jgi:hypothetical protein
MINKNVIKDWESGRCYICKEIYKFGDMNPEQIKRDIIELVCRKCYRKEIDKPEKLRIIKI